MNEIHIEPIGTVVKSAYVEKWGTPRQGGLNPDAIAQIELKDGDHSLQIGERIAVIWFAHLNSASFNHMKARIKPPKKIDGNRTVGVFSVRGVHRPSSIGLTFVTINSISENIVSVTGADMIQGTPILGIRKADRLGMDLVQDVKMPEWTKVQETKIRFSLAAFMSIQLTHGSRSLEVARMVSNVLKQDPRSVHSLRKHVNPVYEVELDSVGWIIYRHDEQGNVDVLFITRNRIVPMYRGRTEPWLTRLVEIFPFIR
jgi:tRNA (Thr-GGU) A37 N-methylase